MNHKNTPLRGDNLNVQESVNLGEYILLALFNTIEFLFILGV